MPPDAPKPPFTIERYIVKPTPLNAALGALLIWLGIAMFLAHGPGGLLLLATFWLVTMVITVVLKLLREEARAGVLRFLFIALTLLTGFWFYFSGSYLSWRTWVWDAASLLAFGLIGTNLTMLVFKLSSGRCKLCAAALAHPHLVFPSLMLLVGWIGIAVASSWRNTPLVRDVNRFEQITPANALVPDHAARWQGLNVGLALSGGGYRAAVYHAGTLHALESLGIRANVLSTVSGGSIIGSYYALGGDPKAFKDAVAAGRFNLKREISLANNALELMFPMTVPVLDAPLFPWHDYTRADVQAGLLRKTLLGDDESWRKPAAKQPHLVVNATELTFGAQVGMLPDGAVVVWANHEKNFFAGDAWTLKEELPLALRVAISGAFPGAFPAKPVKVVPTFAPKNQKTERYEPMFARADRPLMLADGGIFDNTGEVMLRAIDEFARQAPSGSGVDRRYASDVFLVSDGGAVFGVENQLGELGQIVRAADIMSALAQRGVSQATTVSFAPRGEFMSLSEQFRLHGSLEAAKRLPGEDWAGRAIARSDIDTQATYPQPVLERISALLPGEISPRDMRAFRRALSAAMKDKLLTFRSTSTLDDLLSREQVEDLYTLGQLMVYIAWPRIEVAMNNALQNAQSPPPPATKP